MAHGNGHAVGGMMVPPTEHVTFKIGNRDIVVPAMSLADLERIKKQWFAMSSTDWVSNASSILEIVGILISEREPELTFDILRSHCSAGEAIGLPKSFNELLEKSGLILGETQAASPGTGTSTDLPPNSVSLSETQT